MENNYTNTKTPLSRTIRLVQKVNIPLKPLLNAELLAVHLCTVLISRVDIMCQCVCLCVSREGISSADNTIHRKHWRAFKLENETE